MVLMALNQLHLEDNFIRYGHYSPLMVINTVLETTICNLKKGHYIGRPRMRGHNLSDINPEYIAAKSSKTTKRNRWSNRLEKPSLSHRLRIMYRHIESRGIQMCTRCHLDQIIVLRAVKVKSKVILLVWDLTIRKHSKKW